ELDGSHHWPRWSPDGARIVFVANGAGYVVATLGGTPKRVIESPAGAVSTPSWSPDSKEIVYAAPGGIWTRLVAGGPARLLVSEGHQPSWSPDGRRLAFATGSVLSFRNIGPGSIWITAASGVGRLRISDSSHVNTSPVWSADGRSVLYISDAGGARDVYQQAIGLDGRP